MAGALRLRLCILDTCLHEASTGGLNSGRSVMSQPLLSPVVVRSCGDATARRWHLGVQSSLAPADMMLEIFRVLRVLRFEWKVR